MNFSMNEVHFPQSLETYIKLSGYLLVTKAVSYHNGSKTIMNNKKAFQLNANHPPFRQYELHYEQV